MDTTVIINAIIPLVAALVGAWYGGKMTFKAIKWELKNKEEKDKVLDTKQRWVRIYEHLTVMIFNLRIYCKYDALIRSLRRTGTVGPDTRKIDDLIHAILNSGQVDMHSASNYEKKLYESFQKIKQAESEILIQLCGTDGIKTEDKSVFYRIIFTKQFESLTTDEIKSRIHSIEEIRDKHVLFEIDRSLYKIYDSVKTEQTLHPQNTQAVR